MVDGYSEGEEPVIFHYQKGSFRKHEQQIYSDLATGKTGPAKGFFKVLVSSKGNKMIFFTMIVCIILAAIIGFLSGRKNQGSVAGVNCRLSAFSFEDTVYASISLSKNKKSRSKLPVNLEFYFEVATPKGVVAESASVVSTFVPGEKAEPVHVAFPDYEFLKKSSDEKFIVRCRVSAGDEEKVLETDIEKK